MDTLLLDAEVVLEKMAMKGGWTYALLPDVLAGDKKHFGWKKVHVVIDEYDMGATSLMPIKGGRLFVAVKAAVRKAIRKEVGDKVRIRLYGLSPATVAGENDFMDALADVPEAKENYLSWPETEQNAYLNWIFEVSDVDVIVKRMAMAIDDIAIGRKCKYPVTTKKISNNE